MKLINKNLVLQSEDGDELFEIDIKDYDNTARINR